METVVLVTGGFDPIHSGHIEYFKAARSLGDRLIVGLNSDSWLKRKKGRAFMPITERSNIVQDLKPVDGVMLFDDNDGSAIEAIKNVRALFPTAKIIFANGGDRTAGNIPEMSFRDDNLIFKFGVGGENKLNSSSWILEEWKAPKTERVWGYYRVLHDVAGMKVKELTVEPGQRLSMQRHEHRSEYWIVSEGECVVYGEMPNGYALPPKQLVRHESFVIPKGEWHQLLNNTDAPCKIVEVQFGDVCEESDIERKDNQ